MDRNPDKKLIRFDWAIKRLLRDKANPTVLEGFLTSLLGKEIKIVDFIESEGNRGRHDEKSNRVDIVAKDANNSMILIEVQNETEDEYFHRILFGTARSIIDHVKIGDNYQKVPKIYSVNIVYFDLGDRSDYVYHGFTEFRGLHNGQPLLLRDKMKKKFEVAAPGEILPEYYILLANDFDKWSKTPLDQWMYFLSTSTIPEDADAPGLAEAREQLSVDRLSPEERRAYYTHLDNMRSLVSAVESAYSDGEWEGMKQGLAQGIAQGMAEGIEKGMAEGIEKGREQEKWENARNLYLNGVPLETISSALSLPLEDLKSLPGKRP